jgi:membrane protease YdiL (CAAX protease family)
MNRAQKIALFTLVMLVVALVLSLIAVGVAYFGFGLPLRRAASGFGFIGIMGFSALAPLFFRKNKQEVQLDERDLLIKRKAMLAAYGGFWPLFVLAAMIPWFIIGPKGTITVNYLPWMVFGGMFFVALVDAVVTLEEYGWREKGEKS